MACDYYKIHECLNAIQHSCPQQKGCNQSKFVLLSLPPFPLCSCEHKILRLLRQNDIQAEATLEGGK